MKPHFHKVSNPGRQSFSVRHDIADDFGKIWHYHPELELHLTIKGEGVRFIGDNISNFSSGEVILLGENLPHTWHCRNEAPCESSGRQKKINAQAKPKIDTNAKINRSRCAESERKVNAAAKDNTTRPLITAAEEKAADKVEAIVIQFLPDCLGKEFLELPEAYLIPRVFENAKKGMLFKGKTAEKLSEYMRACIPATNMERLVLFLSILKLLAESEEFSYIASAHAFYKSNEAETKRLNVICDYTLANFKKEITLEQIAAMCNLSVASFCRYFKRMTKKTYYDFLVEIRISHACRLLIEDSLPAGMVCLECGFNNVSNFYRHFRKITGLTPLEYKRKYLGFS